ncbi:MAG: FAD binding domain-containing protein [Planctomycetota bacterium]
MKRFAYHRPQTLQEAWRLKAQSSDACFLAGGTDLMVSAYRQGDRPAAVISLRAIAELQGIEVGETTRIGALTTVGELYEHIGLGVRHPILHQAASTLGSPQIRSVATVGGNLCNASPCADMAPPLLVLEAKVRLESARGSREMTLEEFFVGRKETRLEEGELLSALLIAPSAENARTVFMKKSRVVMDLSLASVAMLLELDGDTCLKARVAAGSVAPTPIRLREVEALFEGKTITRGTLAMARKVATTSVAPITDVRTAESYRRQIVGVYVERAAKRLLQWK